MILMSDQFHLNFLCYVTPEHSLHVQKTKQKLNSKIIHSAFFLQNFTFISSAYRRTLTKLMLLFYTKITIRYIRYTQLYMMIIKRCGGGDGGVSFCFRKIHYNNYSHSNRNESLCILVYSEVVIIMISFVCAEKFFRMK